MGNVAPAAAENSIKLGDLAVQHHPPHIHADRRVKPLKSFPDAAKVRSHYIFGAH